MSATKILWGQILTVFAIVLSPPGARRSGRRGGSASSRSSARHGSISAGCPSIRRQPSSGGGTSTTPTRRGSSSKAPAIAASGGFIAIAVAIGMSVWRAREAKNAETYGSARWANADEVGAAGLLGPDGVVLGRFERRLSAP